MEYRILEMIAPPETVEEAQKTVSESNNEILDIWSEKMNDGFSKLTVLLDAERTEGVSDSLSDKFSDTNGFRIMLFPVAAILPQPDVEDKDEEEVSPHEESESAVAGRISREELYSDITSGSKLDKVYIGTVVLSSLVAAVGLMRSDVTVIIGAMVIAPLLGPNVSLALAATLADKRLAWHSVKTNLAGLLASLTVAFIMGLTLSVNPESEELANRTIVSLGDITVALAAGSAGVLAFTRGIPATIIGVMVAVALLPPLVSVGLLLGAGFEMLAFRAGILTLTNLVCINLAGILTFLVQGVRPRNWWDAENAKKASRYAIAIWVALLAAFAFIIWILGKN